MDSFYVFFFFDHFSVESNRKHTPVLAVTNNRDPLRTKPRRKLSVVSNRKHGINARDALRVLY